MKKHDARTEKTKAAIIDSFWEIYGSKSISKITVNDVTRLAGVHRSTFYLYFTDIYDLLAKAEEELLDECSNISLAIAIEDGFGFNNQNTVMKLLVGFYRNHVHKLNALLGAKGDPGFITELKKKLIPQIFRMLSISEDDSEMRILMDYMITAMLTLLTYASVNMPDEPLEATVHRIHAVMTIGIIPLIEAHTHNPELVRRIAEIRTEREARLKYGPFYGLEDTGSDDPS